MYDGTLLQPPAPSALYWLLQVLQLHLSAAFNWHPMPDTLHCGTRDNRKHLWRASESCSCGWAEYNYNIIYVITCLPAPTLQPVPMSLKYWLHS